MPNIALFGKSGSGKSTVAKYLSSQHGYAHCSAGKICRRICRELFESENRAILNAFNDAVRAIDPKVWLRSATNGVPNGSLIVFDSMRFHEDWIYFKSKGYQLWRIDCDEEKRLERLTIRGQVFEASDNLHAGEIELATHAFDKTLINQSNDVTDLLNQVDAALI